MRQIKHKLGDLVYVVCDDGSSFDFKFAYGAIVNIHHKMDEDYRTYLKHIQQDGEYDCDILQYDVLTAYDEIVYAADCEVFDTIQDTLDFMRGAMQRTKNHFEIVF